jgi:hypothetical protein
MCRNLLSQGCHQFGIVFNQPDPAMQKPFHGGGGHPSRGEPLQDPGPLDAKRAGQGFHRDIALPIRGMLTLLYTIAPAVGQANLLDRRRADTGAACGGETFGAQLRRHVRITVDALVPELCHTGPQLLPDRDIPTPLDWGPRLEETRMARDPHHPSLDSLRGYPFSDDMGDETPQQLLLLGPRDLAAVPQGGEGRGPLLALLPLCWGQGRRGRLVLQAGVGFLDRAEGAQLFLPTPFELGGHEPIVRIDRFILPLGEMGLILGPLALFLPMTVHACLLGSLRVSDRLQRLELGRLEGGKKGVDDDLISCGSMQGGTHAAGDAAGEMLTMIAVEGLVTGAHAGPTHPADGQALQERGAFPGGPSSGLCPVDKQGGMLL